LVNKNRKGKGRAEAASIVIGAGALFLAANTVMAGTLTWDPNQSNAPSDASGTWNATTSNWYSGSTDVQWSDGSDAVFGSGSTTGQYVVTLAQSFTANSLTFNNTTAGSNYTLNGSGNTLTITNYPNFSGTTTLENGNFVLPASTGNGFNIPGTLYLDSGANLETSYIGGAGSLYFNGGVIQATRGGYYFQGLANAYVSTGGVTFDTSEANGSQTVGISYAFQHDPNGAATDGGFTKIGSGTITIGTAQSWNGPTNVNGGTLDLTSGGYPAVIPGGTNLNVNNGGTLELSAGDALSYNADAPNLIINTGGTVTVDNGNRVTLQNFTINGGTLTAPSTAGGQGTGFSGGGFYYNGAYYYGNYSMNGNLITVNPAASGAPAVISPLFFALQNALTFNVSRGTGTTDLNLQTSMNQLYGGNSNVTFSGGGIIDWTSGTAQFTSGSTVSISGSTLILDENQPYQGVIQSGTINVFSGGTLAVAQTNALIGYGNGGTSVYVGSGGVLFADAGVTTHAGNVQLDGGTLATGDTTVATGGAATYGSFDFQPGSVLNVTSNSTMSATNVTLEPSSSSSAAASVNVNSGVILKVTGYFGGTSTSLTQTGAGTILLSGSNTYGGSTSINGGTLEVAATGSIANTSSVSIASGSTVTVDFGGSIGVGAGTGTVNVPSGATLSANGSINGNLIVNGGTVTFGNNSSTGILVRSFSGLNLTSGGTVTVAPASSHANRTVLTVGSLSLDGTGKLDLSNNDMIVFGGNLANVTSAVAAGYNSGSWNGPTGIVSSTAAANSTHLTALGVIQNSIDQNGGSALKTSFDGVAVSNTDILVKYTYYGDADLSGVVDGSDYSRVDASFLADLFNPGSVTGWANGDFNYDGTVDGSDYTLIDNAFNSQGASLAASIASPTAQIAGGSTAVPEPGTVSLLAIACTGVLARRRRR
jgi:autotransporter-associated beta strand protein